MEKLFKLANGMFLHIQESSEEGAWDYTIYNEDKTEFDGGVCGDIDFENAIIEICALFNFDKVSEICEIKHDVEFADGFCFEI